MKPFTAGLVTRHQGRVICTRKLFWTPALIKFPSGKGEEGESPLACALRESWEETGIWVKPEHVRPCLDGQPFKRERDDLFLFWADDADAIGLKSFTNADEEVLTFSPEELLQREDEMVPGYFDLAYYVIVAWKYESIGELTPA